MTETEPPASDTQGPAPENEPARTGEVETAPLNRPWVIKMAIFLVILIGVGSWGLYDATVAYPARGEKHASWAEWQYLLAAQQADQNEEFGVFVREASVPDPAAELATLNDPEHPDTQRRNADMNNQQSSRHYRAIMDQARLTWLNSLRVIGEMNPERTTIDNPGARLQELELRWQSEPGLPKPLAGYDLPSQWAIMIVCWGIAAYLLFLFLRVAATRYRWEPATQTLTVPGGVAITPADLKEIDKRKWDKFIVFVTTKDGHPLAGRELRFDTYRHAHLEDWILAMEKTAFGSDDEE